MGIVEHYNHLFVHFSKEEVVVIEDYLTILAAGTVFFAVLGIAFWLLDACLSQVLAIFCALVMFLLGYMLISDGIAISKVPDMVSKAQVIASYRNGGVLVTNNDGKHSAFKKVSCEPIRVTDVNYIGAVLFTSTVVESNEEEPFEVPGTVLLKNGEMYFHLMKDGTNEVVKVCPQMVPIPAVSE